MKKLLQYGSNTYSFIEVEGKWILEHKHNYESVHGPIPKGFCLYFKDRNHLNPSLENLELVTMAENRRRLLEGDSIPFIADTIKAKNIAQLNRAQEKYNRAQEREKAFQEFKNKKTLMRLKRNMSSHRSAVAKRMDNEWLNPPQIKKQVPQGEMVQLKPGLIVELKPGKTIEQLKAKYGVK